MTHESANAVLSGAMLITGGASGIGRAAATACAKRGAKVAVLDVDAATATSVAAELSERSGCSAVGLLCDVRDEASVAKAVSSAVDALGPLRGLVTSAGIDRGGLVHELPLERWLDVLNTNLTGTFLACKHALIQLLAQRSGGSIVCVSSPWADVSVPRGVSAYCASKGGVAALVRSLALDYARYSIRVNAVVPGPTDTALMWANASAPEIPALRRRIEQQLVFGRLAEADEIAAGIVWLLSDQASYVTGSQLVIDGGVLARASIEG